MNVFNAISIGFKEILAHKFRSFLTMLGIILGVASLVAMSALTKGMENGLKEALIAVGGLEKVGVEDQDIPAYQQHLADQAVGETMEDVYALQHSAPLIRYVTPEMGARRIMITHGSKTFSPWQLSGTWPNALDMNQHVIQYGRMFNEIDDAEARSVCVIGTAVRDRLFGSPEEVGREIIPIGEAIYFNDQPFTIIGMFQHYESDQDRKKREELAARDDGKAPAGARHSGWNGKTSGWIYRRKNSTIYIPLNTMWLRFRASAGSNNIPDPHLTTLSLKVADVEHLSQALQQAQNVLFQTHKGIEDFSFDTKEDWADTINSSIKNARLSGGIIAAISLLVGGIGILNIMLASITERIREIGIRKAIGASNVAVFIQILVESVVIAVMGGLTGLVTSYGLVEIMIMGHFTDNTPVITLPAMVLAFIFSMAVGILAGIIPAIKAARLHPIQALRYE